MVGKAATDRSEEVVPLLKGIKQVGIGADVLLSGSSKRFDVSTIGRWIVDGHCFVGAPGGQKPHP